MVLDDHQLAGLVVHVDAAGGVGEDERSSRPGGPARAPGTTTCCERVALVVVHAPRHHRDRHAAGSGRAPARRRGRARSRWGSAGSRRTGCASRRSRLSAKAPRPEPRTSPTVGLQRRPRAHERRRLVEPASKRAHSSTPAMQAVMKLARVPASRARRPEAGQVVPRARARARRCRRSGCRSS